MTRLERSLRTLRLHLSGVIGSKTVVKAADDEIDLALRSALEEVRGAVTRAAILADWSAT